MRKRKLEKSRVKLGHRESSSQHSSSDEGNRQHKEGGYRKGKETSGGGGHIGGGGKKGRPLMGWEKGDVARDVDLSTSPFLLRIKSGKRMKSR